jgi:hypothetical protein
MVNAQDIPPPPFLCDHRSPNKVPSTVNLTGSLRRQVSFHRQEQQSEPQTKVICLSWTDSRGCTADYTGQVNALIQPHGYGYLQYRDGTVFAAQWCNGAPIRQSPQVVPQEPEPQPSPEFTLGDVASVQDMHIEPNAEMAYANAASLPIHSFAFILRSTGEWTYAILANRPVVSGPDASMRFVVDPKGSTKVIKAKYWSRYVRLVNEIQSENIDEDIRMEEDKFDERLERLTSFHRAVRRVSIDMSSRTNSYVNRT